MIIFSRVILLARLWQRLVWGLSLKNYPYPWLFQKIVFANMIMCVLWMDVTDVNDIPAVIVKWDLRHFAIEKDIFLLHKVIGVIVFFYTRIYCFFLLDCKVNPLVIVRLYVYICWVVLNVGQFGFISDLNSWLPILNLKEMWNFSQIFNDHFRD